MRALRLPAVTAVAIFVASVLACGLDSTGLLAVDGGGAEMVKGLGTDAAASASDDASASVTPTPGDDADTSMDATSVTPPTTLDASAPAQPDSATAGDVAVDAPLTCSECTTQKCPKELAACGSGSDCLAYRDCDEACSGKSSAMCTKSCQTMYTAGEAAFAALTICDFNCGVGCVAGLASGTP